MIIDEIAREKKRKYQREWEAKQRRENPAWVERGRAHERKYRYAHKEELAAYAKTYYVTHRKEQDAANAAWRRANPERTENNMLRHNRQRAGYTMEQYDTLLASQGGLCAICGITLKSGKGKQAANADHNHKTGEKRGMLCGRCNLAIGMFEDNPDLLRKSTAYLEKYIPLEFDPWLGEFQSRGLECLNYLNPPVSPVSPPNSVPTV